MDALDFLMAWFRDQCDGDWEHGRGLQISSLDNPGWSLTINLRDTALQKCVFAKVVRDRSERDWVAAQVDGDEFKAWGGAGNLREMLEIFRDWAISFPPGQHRS